ncbi:major facilitator superfamily protein [Planococcus donghaensis MPA1U2]|uniref:Major facilitator superfamily protein n=1 Tax=Planococcus donghaensis MPA1U2 TaxID=933115 RepID=E7RE36_9BACL|nr:MFS transporter [Planococcus donghaensis]EGA90700.1 major facilitator superfamily protein [Planococcus donghaensis MPA1U2]
MKRTKENWVNGNGVIHTPFYYGWVIVILAGLSHFFSGPGQTYSNAIFIDYYIEEFGWSRSTVSGIYSSATLLAGFLLFIIGRMIDKVGARKMAIAVSLILAAASIFNSFVVNWVMLFMGFFAIRLFGQGSMTLVPNALVPQWFIQKRGRALGLAALGGMIGSAAFPLINVWLIEAYGWRTTWQILGASILVIFTPLAYFFIRNRPEDIGLLPDNGPSARKEDPQKPLSSDISWTVKEAKKTRSFWLLLFCVVVPALVNTGMTFHLVSIFSIQSLAPETAATVLSLMAIIGFPVTFLAGYLLDKIRVQWMLAFVFVGEIASIFLLKEADLFSGAILFAVVWGFMLGIERVTLSVIWPNYFGRQYLGSITGISMAFMVVGSALGPLPFGLFYDFFGGYKEVLWVIMIFPLLGIVAALLANPPEKKEIEN